MSLAAIQADQRFFSFFCEIKTKIKTAITQSHWMFYRGLKVMSSHNSVFTTIEWASTGRLGKIRSSVQLLYGPTLSPYSYCAVPSRHRTATVRSHVVTVQLWYGPTWSWFTYSTSQGWFNCCEEAEDSFMPPSWWCPFKMKKGKWPTRHGSLKWSIDWYHFRPLLAVVGQFAMSFISLKYLINVCKIISDYLRDTLEFLFCETR